MNQLYLMAASVGVFAGVWTWVSMNFELITFAGFLSCATFYAAGGGSVSFRKTIICNYSGVFWGYIMTLLSGGIMKYLDGHPAIAVSVGLLTMIMIIQARIKYLDYTPGVFIGTAVFFASGNDITGSLIGLLGGALFGIISQTVGVKLYQLVSEASN